MPKMTIELPFSPGDEVWVATNGKVISEIIESVKIQVYQGGSGAHYYFKLGHSGYHHGLATNVHPTREAAEEWIKEKSNAKTD